MSRKTQSLLKGVYDDDQYTQLLKWFAIASILSITLILCLVGAGMYKIYRDHVLQEAETDAVRLGQIVFQREVETLITQDAKGKSRLMIGEKVLPLFDQRLRKDLQFFRVVKIKLFSKDKKIVYSNDYGIIGKSDTTNESLNKALQGEAVSRIKHKKEMRDITGEQRINMDVVETYFPVKDITNEIVGGFEIYTDISRYSKKIRDLMISAVAVVFIVLVSVFGVLFVLMRHATNLIYAKTQEVKVLSGLLPICSFCKKIRNEAGTWEWLEQYITEHSESQFSHGICPECAEKHYPGIL